MIKIKINASDEIREVTFSRRSEHVIELGGITDAPTTGFTTWRIRTCAGGDKRYTTAGTNELCDSRDTPTRAGGVRR